MEILIDTINESLCAAALEKGHVLEALEIDPEFEQIRHGTIYMGRVDRIDATQNTAYVNLGNKLQGYLNAKDARYLGGKTDKSLPQWLNNGDLVIVQAQDGRISPRIGAVNGAYDDYEDKLVRLTMDITLPGRFTLYAPYRQKNTISSRITDKALRSQLETMIDAEKMQGVVLRAATAHIQNEMIVREYKLLSQIWTAILNNLPIENKARPVLSGPDAVMRMLSNQAMNTIERIEICGDVRFELAQNWCVQFAPDLVSKLILSDIDAQHRIDAGLLENRGVLTPIEDLYRPYAVLANGCSLIIEHTAALTAIDVNRGGASGSPSEINKQVAKEVMRQIRLRNLSGIIIIDYLKMNSAPDKQALTKLSQELALLDPYTVQVHGLTKLGLMEITRARRTPPLAERLNSVIQG
tara:strand:+ start:79500 stop:80729 length:1230 start_codon:yes stop_codon:yes gene_type:complete